MVKPVWRMIALACLVGLVPAAAQAAPPPVTVEGGQVQGTDHEGIAVYKGIPFAAPPVGDLRWHAPEPVKPWQGIRQATHYAPACPQVQMSGKAMGIPEVPTSEDCLDLNIWTPAKSAGAKLPVMVWIYGGGFALGATSWPIYDGTNLASKGVIVVSIAYRVGPFGFLATPELTAESAHHSSGNYGLLDQIAGLKWVHDNIAAFGGDPSNVTIFGESAGGISVSMLCASPLAKGLFARAISESGGSFAPPKEDDQGGENVPTLAHAERTGRDFLKALGVDSIAAARKLTVEQVLKGPGAGMMGGGFWPVADDYVLPQDQYVLYSHGKQNDTPVLIGTNSDEGAIFPHAGKAAVFRREVEAGYGGYAARILKAYPAGSDAEAEVSSKDLFRDTAFAWPTWAWARLQAKTGKGRVFMYYFTHTAQVAPSSPFAHAGATHGSEIGYVFGNLTDTPFVHYTDEDRKVSDMMATYWTNFAKTGDPNGAGVPRWPAFGAARPRVEHIGDTAKPGPVPNLGKLKVLEGYYAWRRSQRGENAR